MTDAMCRADTFGRARFFDTNRTSERAFWTVSVLLCAASAAATIAWSASMPGMAGMPMPGGWMMSMTWMPACGRSWPRSAASFIGMWVVMTAAMMLPSLMPALQRYRSAVGQPEPGSAC